MLRAHISSFPSKVSSFELLIEQVPGLKLLGTSAREIESLDDTFLEWIFLLYSFTLIVKEYPQIFWSFVWFSALLTTLIRLLAYVELDL